MRFRWAWLLALAGGCGPATLPPPRVLSVTPERVVVSDVVTLQLQTELVLPFHVDLAGARATADTQVTVLVGDTALESATYQPDGTVSAVLPSGFEPSTYDVSVRLADGRTGTASQALTIDPGHWPDSFEFTAPIGDQVVDQPFVVTIRAVLQGATDVGFHGNVRLTSNKGDDQVEPRYTAPFDSGLVTERSVRMLKPGQGVMLQIRDGTGKVWSSNPFRVTP